MSLFLATFLTGCFALLIGGLFAASQPALEAKIKRFPRSKTAAFILFGGSSLWFLYHVSNLGVADFGDIRHILLGLFAVVGVGSFFFVRDFLAVRGLAMFFLLAGKAMLDAAYMQEPTQRLLMVTFVYCCIALGLYLAASPFRLRDFFDWLFEKGSRARAFGIVLAAYGAAMILAAFTY